MEIIPRIQAIQQQGDKTFWQDLERSKPYEAAVRRMHSQGGAMTGSYPLQRYEDGQEHDMHDIAVSQAEEVKSRSFNFDSMESLARAGRITDGWPYPTIIIDTCHHIDGNLRRFASWPRCYWIWSNDRAHVLRVSTRLTHPSWVRQWFKVRGRMRAHYVCPLFVGAQRALYTAAAIRHDLTQFGIPCSLIGLRIMAAGELQADARHRRDGKRDILQRLHRSRWVSGGDLVSENPGCAA